MAMSRSAGLQRVFEDEGGRVKDKLWPPLVTPDYTPFLAKMGGVDAIVSGIGGSNAVPVHEAVQGPGHHLAAARRRRGDG